MRATKAIADPPKPAPKQLVQSPQPIRNPKQTQNQKRAFLQKVLEDEVAGPYSLLLLI